MASKAADEGNLSAEMRVSNSASSGRRAAFALTVLERHCDEKCEDGGRKFHSRDNGDNRETFKAIDLYTGSLGEGGGRVGRDNSGGSGAL